MSSCLWRELSSQQQNVPSPPTLMPSLHSVVQPAMPLIGKGMVDLHLRFICYTPEVFKNLDDQITPQVSEARISECGAQEIPTCSQG